MLTGVTSNRTKCRDVSNFIHLPTCLARLCSTSPLCFSVFVSAANVRKHTQRAYSIHIITTVCDYYTNTHDNNMYGAVITDIITARVPAVHLINVEQHQVAADVKTSQMTAAVSPCVGCYHLNLPLLCSITQPRG